MSSVNKHAAVTTEESRITIVSLYRDGNSITEVAEAVNISKSGVRYHIKKAGILRARADGVRNAARKGKLGAGTRGKSRCFSEAHKRNMSLSKLKWAEKNAAGICTKKDYIEFTRGENKGRHQHVVIMEQRLGRRLREDEVVHHIDGDKKNNNINNLALCTKSGHARIHRHQEKLSGLIRLRKEDGTWQARTA